MLDDSNSDLDERYIAWPTSIVDSLIRAQECVDHTSRDFSYFDSLLCLSTCGDSSSTGQDDELSLVQLPNHRRDFAAVSYVWFAPDHTDRFYSPYFIRLRPDELRSSKVRCGILHRITKYLTNIGVSLFWIDQECINQEDRQAKSDAINAMDIVYRRSRFPLGLLSVPLTLERHINHIQQLLAGNLVEERSDTPRQLYLRASFCKAHRVLTTLFRVLCDPWWTRRWTFQEEYCASQGMQLLLPIQIAARRSETEDLVVDSRNFRRQVTLFCIACQEIGVFRSARPRRYCKFILGRLTGYGVLREYGQLADNML